MILASSLAAALVEPQVLELQSTSLAGMLFFQKRQQILELVQHDMASEYRAAAGTIM